MKKLLPILLVLCLLTACAPQNGTQNVTETPPPADGNTAQLDAQTPVPPAEPDTMPAPIAPLPSTTDLTAPEDCTLSVSFEEGDFFEDTDGRIMATVAVYDYERFDMVDIAALAEGSTLLLRGEEVTVTSLEQMEDGSLLINGGIFEGGYELATDESTVFFEVRENFHKVFYPLGEITLPVSADFVFTDNADPDNTGLTFSANALVAEEVSFIYGFSPLNTTIRLADGQITALDRRYIP